MVNVNIEILNPEIDMFNTFIFKYHIKKSGCHIVFSRLATLSISSLRSLDIEANKFYDRAHQLYYAAILTRCYTQHAHQPYID